MGYLIVKLHGCSGSGKTTAARELMASWGEVQYRTDFGKYVRVLRTDAPDLYVVGDYSRPGCGGVDTIPNYTQTMEAVEEFHSRGHVLYEGLLLSTYYGAAGKWTEKWGDDHMFAFLDTPAVTCLDRVQERREKAGSKNKFNPQLTLDKHATIERLYHKLGLMGRRTVLIDHTKEPHRQLRALYELHV
jgi:hypothetical protein